MAIVVSSSVLLYLVLNYFSLERMLDTLPGMAWHAGSHHEEPLDMKGTLENSK